jgi:hypothetical protein
MRHPRIFPGRQGLPATSNIPWNAHRERTQRRDLLFMFLVMWAFIGLAGIAIWHRDWIFAVMFLCCVGLSFAVLQQERRKLYAMLLNKPRSVVCLTMWTEHPWPPLSSEEQIQYFCQCGRLVDMDSAPYFKDTKRFSRICECGRGHFMLRPEAKR